MEHISINLLSQARHRKVIERLQADGIETIRDLLDAKDEIEGNIPNSNSLNADYLFRLKTEIGGEELDALLEYAKTYSQDYLKNYQGLFEEQSNSTKKERKCIPLVMPSDSKLFDHDTVTILNKLIALGEVTQIYGMPGTGKTFLCHHLAANALIDDNLRTFYPEVLYIDCDGGFDISIYTKIVDTLVQNRAKTTQKQGLKQTGGEAVRAKFFEKLHYKRILDQVDLTEMIHRLPELLKQKPTIKLIIFDAFTTHLKSIHDQKSINKIINELSIKILQICSTFNVSVILVNLLLYLQNKKELFGDVLCSNIHNKIYLDKYKSNHFFTLEKSHIPCEGVIQKPIAIRIGDQGFEFCVTHSCNCEKKICN